MWTMGANIARIASAILILPFLARVLSPADFGLIQIAAPFLFFLMIFNDLGMGPALIRAVNPSPRLWPTAFWASLVAAIVMMLVLLLLAPAVAWFFNEPRAQSVLQALALTMLVAGVMIVPGAWMMRTMQFKAMSIIEVVSVSAGIAVAVGGAFSGWGVWSLVAQQVTMFTLKSGLILTFSGSPLRLKRSLFDFSWAELRGIMGFSGMMTNARMIWFATHNVDNMIIGRVLGAAALGFYSIAFRIMMMPIEIFANGLANVLMPTLAQVQDDLPRVRAAMLRTYRIISLFTFPIMAGVAALAQPLTIFILGEKMAPAAYPVAALAIHGAIQSLLTAQGVVYIVLGRLDVLVRWSLITLVSLTICLLIGVNWGLPGASLAYLLSGLICAPGSFRAMLRILEASFFDLWKATRVQTSLAIMMGSFVYLMSIGLPADWSNFSVLAVCIPVGGMIYLTGLVFFDRKSVSEVLDLARSVVAK